jgi:hypothetical protein
MWVQVGTRLTQFTYIGVAIFVTMDVSDIFLAVSMLLDDANVS